MYARRGESFFAAPPFFAPDPRRGWGGTQKNGVSFDKKRLFTGGRKKAFPFVAAFLPRGPLKSSLGPAKKCCIFIPPIIDGFAFFTSAG